MRFKFFFLPRGCHIISLSPFEIQSNWFFILPCYPLACIVDLIDQVVKRYIYIKRYIILKGIYILKKNSNRSKRSFMFYHAEIEKLKKFDNLERKKSARNSSNVFNAYDLKTDIDQCSSFLSIKTRRVFFCHAERGAVFLQTKFIVTNFVRNRL